MNPLNAHELELLIESLTFGIPNVENGSAPADMKRTKVDAMKALIKKLKEMKRALG